VDATFADKYHGANVKVQFTVPKSSSGCAVELAPQAITNIKPNPYP